MSDLARTWSVTASVGGSFPGVAPVFLKDNNRVAVITQLSLKLFLLSTKQVVAKIPLDGGDVSQLYLTEDEAAFFVVRKSGHVEGVGIYDGAFTKIDTGRRVLRLISGSKSKLLALLEASDGLSIATIRIFDDRAEVVENIALPHADLWALSSSNEYIALAQRSDKDSTLIYVHNINKRSETRIVRDRRISSLAVSNEGIVAAGGSTGVIDLYYQTGVRSLKWHLEPTTALEFSMDGNYLLSGGKERVLVFWQMEADRPQFLPRLDGVISKITVNHDSSLYGLTLADSQLVVISSTDLLSRLLVAGVKSYFGKTPADPEKERKRYKKAKARGIEFSVSDWTSNYTIHPGTRNGYFFTGSSSAGGLGAHVQAFSPVLDEEELTLSVAPSLSQGRVRKEQLLADPDITNLEFTASGDWMVTVDVKKSASIDALLSREDTEINLKFWRYEQNNTWTLVSRIVAPHGTEHTISAVRAFSTDNSVLTVANDGSIRLWRPDTKTQTWSVRRILPGFRTVSKAVALAVSSDSSAIALGFETSIYLIDAGAFKVHGRVLNILGSRVRALEFVGKYLVALAKSRLVVWDLVANRQLWSVAVHVPVNGHRLLAVDPVKTKIALAVNYFGANFRAHSRVVLFDVQSSVPLGSLYHAHPVAALNLVPGTSSYSFLDTRGVINSVAGATPVVELERPNLRNVLLQLYNETRAMDSKDSIAHQAVTRLSVNSFEDLFDGDNTTLDTLFESVLTLVSPHST